MDVLIVAWLICAIAGAVIAGSKGRSAFLGLALGAVFGLLGVAIVAVLPREEAR